MPLIHTDLPASKSPRVSVRPSVAIEIEWALASGEREDYRADHPVLAAVYEAHPDLQARVDGIWGPGEEMSCGGFMELMVLAHAAGLLFATDADELLDRLEELCTTPRPPEDGLPLLTETADDRRVILLRLERLRESGELRRAYVELVRDMWAAVRAEWERSGRGAVEVAVAIRRELEAKGADWHEVARSECDFGELLDSTVANLAPDGELVVVPAFFTHKGLLVDLPGVVVVGVRTDTTGAQARARTEALARRLKAISDPTRLAMLDALRNGPLTVTEIAVAFALAQPTVSNHVKVLRDAGLVSDVRDGTRRHLIVEHREVEELLTNLHDVLSGRQDGRQLTAGVVRSGAELGDGSDD
ncbi:MAG: metalloregulator ArsR/SmtB family transcription factor [Acidimicrobiales bacterium]|jgi:DNA-binding transcriptional ArsR family regulator